MFLSQNTAARPPTIFRRRVAIRRIRLGLALGAVCTLALFVAIMLAKPPQDRGRLDSGIVVIDAPRRGLRVTATAASEPVSYSTSHPADLRTEMLIRDSLGDQTAALHQVRASGSEGEHYCGEFSSPGQPARRRFIWIAAVRMIATDDGSADFEDLVSLCETGV